MTSLKAVTFDVWNTLLRLSSLYESIASVAAERLGLSRDEALKSIMNAYLRAKKARREGKLPQGREVVTESLKIMSEELKCGVNDLSGIIREAFNSVRVEDLLIEGALNAVKGVKSMGLRVGILGNVLFWGSELTVEVLRRAGFEGLVDTYVFADRVGYSKPDVRIFRHALRELGVEASEALHVGDGVVEDLGGALSSCMAAALVTPQVSEVLSVGREVHFIPSVKYVLEVIRRV